MPDLESQLQSLSGPQRKMFRRLRDRAIDIGEEEAERCGNFERAKAKTIHRVRGEFDSIIATILIGLLVKVAVEAIWAYLKHKWPDVFTGPMPSDEGMIS